MTDQPESSTERRRSFHEETDEAICEDFLRGLQHGKQLKLEDWLKGIDEPRRSQLESKLILCRDSHGNCLTAPSEETTDWTADSAAADVSRGFETIQRLGRYRIQGTLGRGTFGQVFLALDEHLDRLVAIKTPRSHRVGGVHDIEKFQNEAKILAQLDHPAVVPVYDYGMTDEHRCYVVSKYIDGTDLATRILQEKPTIVQAAQWMADIALALHHAHTRRLVHRDVKPGNILLDKDDKPYLADFGLAMREEDFGQGSPYAGTVYYMSPEQARGEGHRVDGRSDVFSLGVVLYLLLTAKRPFGGVDKNEVLERITKQEATPPRQKNNQIPKELERICLRSLAKRASDRYATAQEMADDLQHFLAEWDEVSGTAVGVPLPSDEDSMTNIHPVMPKGLRAFDSQDAEFFLGLLPGPYDRHGLPQVVRFWKGQIERMEADETFRVGLIYGPSGCGKSSLIKAGILPNLTPNIRPVILDATPDDTEAALLARIRNRCPDMDPGADLTETLTAIRRGRGLPDGEKLLIVIDQCEQWLHARYEYADSQLCQALRQCDGRRVQCILLIRDDFWMSASRFMQELEVRIVEGENSTIVDLFDKRHARKVLSAFGRAYGVLPARTSETTPEQKRFLSLALDGLANEGKVISVQLVLFAEMVKHKPWTPDTLRQVGGIQGIGATFLEEVFDSETAVPEHRLLQVEARAVLASLLPEHGTDIKGHTRSHGELFADSRCGNTDRFEDLMRILNTELRLLTPAESQQPDSKGDGEASTEKCYQLAHDYLVPSLRQWLTRRQRETRRGRAGLLLAERAEFWNAKPERKQLPSLFEWLTIKRYVRNRDASETQRKMLASATRMHLTRASLVVLALLAAGWAGKQVYNYEHSSNLLARAMDADISEIVQVVEDIKPYRRWVNWLLPNADAGGDPHRELARLLVKRPLDADDVQQLLERLLIGTPDEVQVIRQTLATQAEGIQGLTEQLWTIVEDVNRTQHERFRAACALAELDATSQRWKANSSEVSRWLVAESPVTIKDWGELFSPVHEQLLEPLKVLFRDDQEALKVNAATVLSEYLVNDVEQLVQLNRTANTPQRRVLVDALRENKARQNAVDLLHREVERNAQDATDDDARGIVAQERANAATLLMLLDEPDEVWSLFALGPDPQVRTCMLHAVADARIEPDVLINRLMQEKNASRRIGLLQTLAQYQMTWFSPRHRARLVPMLLKLFENDPHSGVHSASELLLRRLGHAAEIAELNRRLQSRDPVADRNWYVSSAGDTMVVLRDPRPFIMGTPRGAAGWQSREDAQEVTLGRSYAIATKEVTFQQFRVMWKDYLKDSQGDRNLDHPFGYRGVDTMMGYCLWLSESQGLPSDQCCYERLEGYKHRPYPDIVERTGYRLPTEAEWEFACRAGTTTLRYDGYGTGFIDSFAWHDGIAKDGETLPVGSLLPNEWGMFDVYGNATEFCQNLYRDVSTEVFLSENPHQTGVLRGGSCSISPSQLRSASRRGEYRESGAANMGFRVARTLSYEHHIIQKGQ